MKILLDIRAIERGQLHAYRWYFHACFDINRFLRRKKWNRIEQVWDIQLISCIYSGTKQKCKRVSSCRCPNGARWISKKWREDYTRRDTFARLLPEPLGIELFFTGIHERVPPSREINRPPSFPWVFFCNPRWSSIRVFQIRRVCTCSSSNAFHPNAYIFFNPSNLASRHNYNIHRRVCYNYRARRINSVRIFLFLEIIVLTAFHGYYYISVYNTRCRTLFERKCWI